MFSFNLNDFVLVWMGLLYEALPFVVMGSIISGLVETFVSREFIVRVLPRRRSMAILASAFLGVVFPMCECGIVPVARRLVLKGVPTGCAIAYMLAAPIVHPLVLTSTVIAFAGKGALPMVLLRASMGVTVATVTGWIMWHALGDRGILLPRILLATDAPDSDPHHLAPHSMLFKLRAALHTGASDFVTFGGFLVAGTAAAALINSGFSRAAVAPVAERPLLSIIGMMALAIVLNVCSEADAFIAASFTAFSVPAKLAFLVLGPMLDLKLMVMFTAVFRKRAIVLLCSLMIGLILLMCLLGGDWMTDWVTRQPPAATRQVPPPSTSVLLPGVYPRCTVQESRAERNGRWLTQNAC